MGMLICIVIAFAVTLGGFAILRRQMAKTDLEETKEQSYEAHYAFIVDNPEDEYWQQVYEAAKEEGKKQNIYVEQIFENVSQTYETKEYMDIAIAEKSRWHFIAILFQIGRPGDECGDGSRNPGCDDAA